MRTYPCLILPTLWGRYYPHFLLQGPRLKDSQLLVRGHTANKCRTGLGTSACWALPTALCCLVGWTLLPMWHHGRETSILLTNRHRRLQSWEQKPSLSPSLPREFCTPLVFHLPEASFFKYFLFLSQGNINLYRFIINSLVTCLAAQNFLVLLVKEGLFLKFQGLRSLWDEIPSWET